MKLARTTAALVLAAPIALTLAPSAHAAAVRCRGEAATIVGSSGRNFLTGTAGADVIVGRGGNDTIDGGGGDDVICGGPGRDTIDGGPGDDRLSGNSGIDTITDGDGDDRANGGKGPETRFTASAGDDVLDGGSTAPSFSFGRAPGPMTVDMAAGTAAGFGNDILRVASGRRAIVQGSPFADTLLGSPQGEWLRGGGGVDVIDGRGGADNLVATDGDLSGGDGADSLLLLDTGTVDGGQRRRPDRRRRAGHQRRCRAR
jgi:Ca2+-binding RTX toxin-like protein